MADFLKKLFKGEGGTGAGGSDSEAHDALRKAPLFENLSDGELRIVEGVMHTREFSPAEVIMYSGAAGHGMYLIVKGTVVIAPKPGDPPIAELNDGEFFGEMALFDNAFRSAAAVARTHCKTIGLYSPDFHKLIEHSPKLGVKILTHLMSIIGERLRNTNEQVALLQREIAGLKAGKGRG